MTTATAQPAPAHDPASDELDRTFAALAHPTRRAMLARLASGAASATELGAPFPISQPAVSRHLKVLEGAGLIARGRDAQWRPCELRTGSLRAADEWMSGFRRIWEERLDRLDEYLRETRRNSPTDERSERADDLDDPNDEPTKEA